MKMTERFYTVIDGDTENALIAHPNTRKSAVTDAAKAARGGHTATIHIGSPDGPQDAEAMRMLEDRLSRSNGVAGNVPLRNALVELSLLCQELAKSVMKNPLKEDAQQKFYNATEHVTDLF